MSVERHDVEKVYKTSDFNSTPRRPLLRYNEDVCSYPFLSQLLVMIWLTWYFWIFEFFFVWLFPKVNCKK